MSIKTQLYPASIFVTCIMLLTGCDPLYTVDYEVHNESGAAIQVIRNIPEIAYSDTSQIASGTQLVFFEDSGLGKTTDDYIDELKVLPIELIILNRAGVEYKKDENDLQWWNQVYPGKAEGIGRVYLRVRTQDFE